jgi:hypothetical protein
MDDRLLERESSIQALCGSGMAKLPETWRSVNNLFRSNDSPEFSLYEGT